MKWHKKLTTDLREFGIIKRLTDLNSFQFILILPTMLIFILATVTIVFGVQHAGFNWGMVFTWVVWWGMLIALFVIFGRGWCIMCPFGALGEWVQRLSLWWKSKWGIGLNLKYPKRLKNLWMAIVFFVIFIFLDSGYGISNSPPLTAGLLVVLTVGAIWVGLIFEKRTFCLYHCPLTAFIGIASMMAPFEVRRKDADVCRQCKTKACFNGSENTYGCPMNVFQGSGVDKNRDCILCTECVTSCPYNNIKMRFRPFGYDLWNRKKGKLDESVGSIVIAGAVTIVSLFLVLFLTPVRSAVSSILFSGTNPGDWVRIISIGFLFLGGIAVTLLLMYGFSYLSKRFSGVKDIKAKAFFVNFGYALVPLGIMKFLADILDHVLRTWGAVFDVTRALAKDFPLDRVYASELTVRQLVNPAWTYVMQLLLTGIGFGFSLYVAYKLSQRMFADRNIAFKAFLPIGASVFVVGMAALWALSAAL